MDILGAIIQPATRAPATSWSGRECKRGVVSKRCAQYLAYSRQSVLGLSTPATTTAAIMTSHLTQSVEPPPLYAKVSVYLGLWFSLGKDLQLSSVSLVPT